jgi:hypothetical protein
MKLAWRRQDRNTEVLLMESSHRENQEDIGITLKLSAGCGDLNRLKKGSNSRPWY